MISIGIYLCCQYILLVSLVLRPLPAFQCCTLNNIEKLGVTWG